MAGIVLADDEPFIRQGFLTIDWEAEGFELLGVGSNGLEALELARATKPNIVLTDIRMPGMDGIALMRTIRAETPDIKVILLTAYHEFEYARAAVESGAAGFVLKPSDPEDILQACRKAKRDVEQHLARDQREHELRRQLKAYSSVMRDSLLPGEADIRSNEIIAKALHEMEADYDKELTIAAVAERVHLSPVYLSRLFKKETGETFSDMLLHIRLRRAVELIKDRNIRIFEIAERVGFKDARYFGQVFRKHLGSSPRQLRDRLLRDGGRRASR